MGFVISHSTLGRVWDWAGKLEGAARAEAEEARKTGINQNPKFPIHAACRLTRWQRISSPAELKPSVNLEYLAKFERLTGIERPIDLLVGKRGYRRKQTNLYRSHFFGTPPISDQFISFTNDIVIGSPELCICQLSSQLDSLELLMLIYEFCGGYVLDELADDGFLKRNALTDVQTICSLCEELTKMHGSGRLRSVICHATDGSNSPRETGFALMNVLPAEWGGYEFSHPYLNYDVPLSPKAQALCGKRKCICDMFFSEAGVDVEYQSAANHSQDGEKFDDSARAAALALEGIEVVNVYTDHLKTPTGADAVATIIGKKIGEEPCLYPEFASQRRKLQRVALGHHAHPWR